MATSKKTGSSKSNRFQFSWLKLLVGLSLALNLAFIVFLITLFRTTYFDASLTSLMIGRDFDKDGCYTIVKIDDSLGYHRACNTMYFKDKNNIIVSPEWLKGQKAPIY